MPSSMSRLCTEHRQDYREVCEPNGLFNAPFANLTAAEAHRSACAKRSSPYGHSHYQPLSVYLDVLDCADCGRQVGSILYYGLTTKFMEQNS